MRDPDLSVSALYICSQADFVALFLKFLPVVIHVWIVGERLEPRSNANSVIRDGQNDAVAVGVVGDYRWCRRGVPVRST